MTFETTTQQTNETRSMLNREENSSECSPELEAKQIAIYETAQEVTTYCFFVLLLVTVFLNGLLLFSSIKGRKNSVISEMMFPKMVLLVISDVLPVVGMTMYHAIYCFAQTTPDSDFFTVYSVFACKIPTFLVSMFTFISSWIVFLLAVERYIVLTEPLTFARHRCSLNIATFALICIAMLLAVPKLVTMTMVSFTDAFTVCEVPIEAIELFDFDALYTIALFAMTGIVPLLLLLLTSMLLFNEVRKATSRPVTSQNDDAIREASETTPRRSFQMAARQSNRSTIMMMTLIIVYFALSIPDIIMWLISRHSAHTVPICHFIASAVQHQYLSMLSCLAYIANPAIILGFKYWCHSSEPLISKSCVAEFAKTLVQLVRKVTKQLFTAISCRKSSVKASNKR